MHAIVETTSSAAVSVAEPASSADGFARVTELDEALRCISGLASGVASAAAVTGRDAGALCVDRIRALEDAKSLICAEQAKIAVAFDALQRQQQAEVGVPPERQGRGIAAQVALARRESPRRGKALLGMAKILAREMPHTRARLEDGALSEFGAMTLVRETACLELDDRRAIDQDLCSEPATIAGWGNRRLLGEVTRRAQKLDPAAAVKRAEKARSERTVTLRPAPGEMTYLTALLPLEAGVACLAALHAAAATAHTIDDDTGEIVASRSRGQVVADTLVERITGQRHASDVPIRVNLVVSDETLLDDGNEPALIGDQTIPAPLARRIATEAARSTRAAARTELRRVYASPATAALVALESRSRLFPAALADFIDIRDQRCRTPYCDAPIRHHDHIRPHENRGQTTSVNGQGLCEGCNYAKQAPDWRAQSGGVGIADRQSGRHTVVTQTPTEHPYVSRAPSLPSPLPLATEESDLDPTRQDHASRSQRRDAPHRPVEAQPHRRDSSPSRMTSMP